MVEMKTLSSLRARMSRNMMGQTMLLLLLSFILVDVRCPRPHSLFGCVVFDVPKPHSCAFVGHDSDGEFVLPAAADELTVVAESLIKIAVADELAVVAAGLIEGHPLAPVWLALHAFASNFAAAGADGRRCRCLSLPQDEVSYALTDSPCHEEGITTCLRTIERYGNTASKCVATGYHNRKTSTRIPLAAPDLEILLKSCLPKLSSLSSYFQAGCISPHRWRRTGALEVKEDVR